MTEETIYNKEFYDFITGKASTAINRRLQQRFNKNGITITTEQWSVLFQLWEKEGITQQQIAAATFKDKPSVSRLLNNLEKLNMVVRVPHQQDKRTNLIYLTKKGKELRNTSMRQAKLTIDEALSGVSNEDLQTCYQTLQKVFANLR